MTPPDWLPVLSTALRRQAADLVAEHDLPGMVVGLAAGTDQDNALAWSQGFGWGGGPSTAASSAPGSRPLDADTQFRVASITKTFTATAVVQLRDAGKLHLDDPLVQHVPEFAAVESPFGRIEDVTLRRLASHSSGLVGEPPLDHWLSLRFPTREEWLASLPGVKVAIPPGSAFKYSNLGYTLLGEVVERVSGMPYVEYMQQAVFGARWLRQDSRKEDAQKGKSRDDLGHSRNPLECLGPIQLERLRTFARQPGTRELWPSHHFAHQLWPRSAQEAECAAPLWHEIVATDRVSVQKVLTVTTVWYF